ncbi:MAG: hypothetical protein K2M07_00685 [Muribaculaceae bacterium]|nr:hypothetical protein [Muribaculaceae bacterium]
MNRGGKIKNVICFIALTVTLSGCFTGIESTPRITATDVRRENVQTTSPEQLFGSTLVSDSLRSWSEGREFIVVDERIKLLFSSTPESSLPPVGDVISFAGVTPVKSLMGDTVTLMKFVTRQNPVDTLIYRIDASPSELYGRQTVNVPFVIDSVYIRKIDAMLSGMTLYPLTSTRYTADGQRIRSRKFVPVKVIGVTSGNTDFPLRVNFSEPGGSTVHSMLMSGGAGKLSTRNFDSLFSLSDPREKYPAISDKNWEAITNETVLPDMTRDECRLSLGRPADVIHGHSYSSTYERWVYTSGAVLEFEDGLLKKFRL